MATVTLKGNAVTTVGEPPKVGSKAPDFRLVTTELGEVTLKDFAGKTLVLNIFPSVDTATCATSVRQFNVRATQKPDAVVLCVSKDLPFAFKRFCAAEGIDKVKTGSDFRDPEFGRRYGLTMVDGPIAGLLARAVVVVGKDGTVRHVELVGEIANEPDYTKALAAIG
ncbi:MAG TPA: thiol peroxidase [Planctomycetota bacterium]|nr:thiol peroxidase [Planctomycetota bacterium]